MNPTNQDNANNGTNPQIAAINGNQDLSDADEKLPDSEQSKIRQICTYYSKSGEGTAGYSLSEEQFQQLFKYLAQRDQADQEAVLGIDPDYAEDLKEIWIGRGSLDWKNKV